MTKPVTEKWAEADISIVRKEDMYLAKRLNALAKIQASSGEESIELLCIRNDYKNVIYTEHQQTETLIWAWVREPQYV